LLQIDDVNAVALAKDVFLHLGVPALGLVPEVDARFEQLFHGDVRQTTSLYGLHPPRYRWPRSGLHSCPQYVAGRFWFPKLAASGSGNRHFQRRNTKNFSVSRTGSGPVHPSQPQKAALFGGPAQQFSLEPSSLRKLKSCP